MKSQWDVLLRQLNRNADGTPIEVCFLVGNQCVAVTAEEQVDGRS